MLQSDAEIIKPIQIVNEANRKARHAIRKAIEAARDHGNPNLIEYQSDDLQAFVLHLADHAARGYEKL